MNKTSPQEIDRIFQLQAESYIGTGLSSYRERRVLLKKLLKTVIKYKPEIAAATFADYRKSKSETYLTEVYQVVSEIRYILSNLENWMRPVAVSTPLMLLGSQSTYRCESKGQVLIIAPWNFPLVLTIGPLAMAIAAGNTVMVKPSEMTPSTCEVVQNIVREVFDEKMAAVILGGVETSTHLLKHKFHHIFFTGSPRVGKIVMEAAAKNLASITLELGGKSPTIIGPNADLKMAAERIAWAKSLNAGQICIAPDYILIQDEKKAEFMRLVRGYWQKFYPENSEDYTHIVNREHYERLDNMLDQSQGNRNDNRLSPVVEEAKNLSDTARTEEIFGPILPVYTYQNAEEIIDFINSGERPLTMYVYNKGRKWNEAIINATRSGSVCINHNVVHFFNTDLPFGGINNSGTGRSHGRAGFEGFSDRRAIFKQKWAFAWTKLIYPPYTGLKQRLIDFLIKWI